MPRPKKTVTAPVVPTPRPVLYGPPPKRPPTGVTKDWSAISQFPRARWEVDVDWKDIDRQIEHFAMYSPVDLNPDFQREHVWTPAQRVAYLEYVLSGGELGRTLIFATDSWDNLRRDPTFFYLADGKQRLETVRSFLRGELRIFPDDARPEGYLFEDFTGVFRGLLYSFRVRVVEVHTRADAIGLYLAINAGGTPHTEAEIAKARALRDAELSK